MRVISSRQNPTVHAFRDLARSVACDGSRVLLDGVHLIRDAHAAGVALEIVVVASSRVEADSEEGRLAARLAREGVDVVQASDSVCEAVSPVRSPSGITAIGRYRPNAADPASALDACVVAAVDVQDPGNVGAVVRTAEAGGATGVYVCGASANPFSWKALRGSMGSAFRVPVVAGITAEDAVGRMRRSGLRTVAAVPREGRHPDAIDWSGRLGILVGGEGPGLAEPLIAQCDDRVTIPMTPPVESLNVAVAAGILIYAARRRRT